MFDTDLSYERIIHWLLFVVSLTIHEWAHAWTAYKLGDDTAERLGRMTFNPLVHIDLFGTVILPLIGAPFAFAKPVPVQPNRFRPNISMSGGMLLVAIAGPISNLIQAIVGGLLVALCVRLQAFSPEFFDSLQDVMWMYVVTNVSLAVFNMIPLPPLDGSRVVNHFLPYSLRPAWHRIEAMGILPVAILCIILRQTKLPLLEWPILQILKLIGMMVRALIGL